MGVSHNTLYRLMTPLTHAVYYDMLPHIKYLIELGLDMNWCYKTPLYYTPLHIMFLVGSEETIKYIIETYPDVLGSTCYNYDYPYVYLIYNTKIDEETKIQIYNKVFEKIKKTYKWFPYSPKLKIPTKPTDPNVDPLKDIQIIETLFRD